MSDSSSSAVDPEAVAAARKRYESSLADNVRVGAYLPEIVTQAIIAALEPLVRRTRVPKEAVVEVLPDLAWICTGKSLLLDEYDIQCSVEDAARQNEALFYGLLGGGHFATMGEPLSGGMGSGSSVLYDLIEYDGVAYLYEYDYEGMGNEWVLEHAYRVGDEAEYANFVDSAVWWLASRYASYSCYTGERFPEIDMDLVRARAKSPHSLGELEQFMSDISEYGYDSWDAVAESFAEERGVPPETARTAVHSFVESGESDELTTAVMWWIFEEHVQW